MRARERERMRERERERKNVTFSYEVLESQFYFNNNEWGNDENEMGLSLLEKNLIKNKYLNVCMCVCVCVCASK